MLLDILLGMSCPPPAELAKDSRLKMGSESKNRDDARELSDVSSPPMSKSPTGIPSFNNELMSLNAPVGQKDLAFEFLLKASRINK